MTDVNGNRMTLIKEVEADPVAALDLAAARGTVEGSALLARVFTSTGITQKELARRAGVTSGRVSQVLSGDENLRLSTVARYLHAMGFRLRLSALSLSGDKMVEAGRPKKQRSKGALIPSEATVYGWMAVTGASVTSETVVDADGVGVTPVLNLQVSAHFSLENPQRIWPRSEDDRLLHPQPIEVLV